MSVPRARRGSNFESESIDDELVLLDLDMHAYHTLSNKAADIWLAADGTRDEEAIARLVFEDCSPGALVSVRIGLSALAEAGLMEGDSRELARLSRRRAAQLATAAVLGLVSLPVVTSITIPDAAAQFTCLPKIGDREECTVGDSCRCVTGCCCTRPGLSAICYDEASCRAAGGGYSCI